MMMIGRRLAHYEITEKIGEGGMGEVYLARDSKLERQVALKVLPEEWAAEPGRLARFEREAKAVAALNHPNIVHVYSVEEIDGVHFFTMELVDGKPLGALIPPAGMEPRQLFDLAIALADALAEAHDHGVIHRDLKPSNIMIDRKGRPKILDFGLAKLRQPETTADVLSQAPTQTLRDEDRTAEGVVLGTYPYMSPEQVEGRSVDQRSDLFSLGVVLYQMATGHKPFRGDSPISIMSAILKEEPPAVDANRGDLPHHLGRVIHRCLEKDPERRYQRAADLRHELQDLRDEAIPTRVSGRRQPARIGRRSPLAITGLATLLILLITAVVYMSRRDTREAADTAAPEPLISSLAVLPLENLSGDPEQDYYAAGITEGLIADLSRVSALRVISRQSVMRFKGSGKSLPEIAAELGVDALIEGSVLPAGDRVRVAAQLVQAHPEQHLWAETYERETKDVLALLSEVTQAITAEVRVVVSPDEEALLTSTHQVDPEAHRLYLRGAQSLRRLTPVDVSRAAELFRDAIELDPTYAEPWAGLASYHQMLEFWGLPIRAEDLRRISSVEADAALSKALELDSSLSQAYQLMGSADFWRDWDWEGAEAGYRRAIELSPNDSSRRIFHAVFLSAMGRHEEAAREADVAEQLDPLSQLIHRLRGDIQYYAHDFEASVRSYERSLELDPGNLYALGQMGFSLFAMGRPDEAVIAWQTIRQEMGEEELARSMEGKTFEEASRLWLAAAKDPSYASVSGPSVIAVVHAMIGEYEKALDWLEKGYATREDPGKSAGWMMPFIREDPFLAPLHGNPRFQELLRQMNLAD